MQLFRHESEKVKRSQLWLFATPWTVTRQAPSSVHGILQARISEWVAIPFLRGSSQSRNRIHVSWIAGRFFTIWATREARSFSFKCLKFKLKSYTGCKCIWLLSSLEKVSFHLFNYGYSCGVQSMGTEISPITEEMKDEFGSCAKLFINRSSRLC